MLGKRALLLVGNKEKQLTLVRAEALPFAAHCSNVPSQKDRPDPRPFTSFSCDIFVGGGGRRDVVFFRPKKPTEAAPLFFVFSAGCSCGKSSSSSDNDSMNVNARRFFDLPRMGSRHRENSDDDDPSLVCGRPDRSLLTTSHAAGSEELITRAMQ